MLKNNIKLDGHRGTFYVIKTKQQDGKEIFLLESEQWGDEANHVVVNSDLKVLLSNEYNGFHDYFESLETSVFDVILDRYGVEKWKENDPETHRDYDRMMKKYWGVANVDYDENQEIMTIEMGEKK